MRAQAEPVIEVRTGVKAHRIRIMSCKTCCIKLKQLYSRSHTSIWCYLSVAHKLLQNTCHALCRDLPAIYCANLPTVQSLISINIASKANKLLRLSPKLMSWSTSHHI